MPLVRAPCADWIGTIAFDNNAKRKVSAWPRYEPAYQIGGEN